MNAIFGKFLFKEYLKRKLSYFMILENSRIVLCLISPYYIASKVCQEEYNLAMNLICDPAYGTVLFPILVEPVEKLPAWCCDYPPLDTSKKNISTFLSEIELLKGMSVHCLLLKFLLILCIVTFYIFLAPKFFFYTYKNLY